MKEIKELYKKNSEKIKEKLESFKKVTPQEQYSEFIFCLLTPQSNAQNCWKAVEQLLKIDHKNKEITVEILKSKTRFHNTKANYIVNAQNTWEEIKPHLDIKNRKELRNLISDKVKGYGLKEAGHFLRNIGKSENQIAILDRHILRNLRQLGVLQTDKIKSRKDYLEIEEKFLEFSKKIEIPIDELDLLFWSKENGEIFK